MGNEESKPSGSTEPPEKPKPTADSSSTPVLIVVPDKYKVDKRVGDPSLPLVERLRYALVGKNRVMQDAVSCFGDLREGHDKDKLVDNALKTTGASLGIASAGLGIGALVTGIVLAPVTGGISLVAAWLGGGAIAAGVGGTAVHVTSEAMYRIKLKQFNEQAAVFIEAYNEHQEALSRVLKKIDGNVEMLKIKFKLEQMTALVVTLANPEEINITDELFGKISRNWIINGLLQASGITASALAGMNTVIGGQAISGLVSSITNIISHSAHLGTLFRMAADVGKLGARVVGGVAVGLGAALSIVDLVVLIVNWKDVPPNVQEVEKVREELEKRRVVVEECLKDVERLQTEMTRFGILLVEA